MVKVQKPVPKSFTKIGIVENTKMKKTDKLIKIKKNNDTAIDTVKKTDKKKLLKDTVKEEVNVNVTSTKKDKGTTKFGKSTKKEKKIAATLPAKKEIKQKKEKPTKSLVLAPPESPAPIAPTPKIKEKSKKAKKNVEKSTPPATTTEQKKQKQKSKSKKTKLEKDNKNEVPLTKMEQKKRAKRAFKKQQIKAKLAGKDKKEKKPKQLKFEPVPFDEDKFHAILHIDNIKEIATALKAQAEQEVANKKTSIFDDYRYMLNVSSFKIANCPKRMVKLSLKHSLVDKDNDVVIIVPDIIRGMKVDYEPTIQHYENLFRENGIDYLKIMPFNQLRKECKTFESVRKFSNSYDYFLCDGRIVGHVTGFCGKIFQKPRTSFHSVRLGSSKNIKVDIERALNRTAYRQLCRGDMISIPVGNHKFTMEQLAENIVRVVAQLKKLHPGGYPNIRSLNLKIDIKGTSSLPIYISVGKAPEETPNVIGPREQRMLKLKKEANEILAKFNVNKYAEIIPLNKTQEENKRKMKEARLVALSKDIPEQPQDEDGEETVVPAKKAKKEEKPVRDLKKDEDKKDDGEQDEDPEHSEPENEVEDEDDDDDEEEDVDDDDEGEEEDCGSSEVEEEDDDDDENDDDDDENEDDEEDDDGEGEDGEDSE